MSAEPSQRPASCREFVEDLTGQSRAGRAAKPAETSSSDVWYLVYRDETGQSHTVKGATDGIRKALSGGLLGDASAILIGKSKTGQFVPLSTTPEFRDLVVQPGRSDVVPGTAARRSGTVPAPTAPRFAAQASPGSDHVDLGAPVDPADSPSRGNAGRSAVPPHSRQTPTSPPVDPRADTAVHAPPVSAHTPISTPIPSERRTRERQHYSGPPSKPFDWTPILMVLVALLSAAVGYLLITRP
jgi:hypothetical protein